MRPIFCGNFEFDAHQSDLERLFKRYGKVDRVEMKSGFAFVYMDDDRDAEDAIRGLDRKEFGRKGRRLRVEWTKHEQRGGGKKQAGSRRSANVRPSKTLFVINFPYETRTRDLERHFEPYGKLVNVRIRRNFAFVQYEFQEDATKALDATHSSKMLDKVISVEYASRDDDDRRNGHSPDGRRGGRDRSPDRRRRSPSPYARERGSPDYGRGSSPVHHRRGSPDYGHRPRPNPSPRRGERGSPDYHQGRSRSPQRGKASPEQGQALSPSPRRKEKGSPDYDRERSRSLHRGKASPGYRRALSRSPRRGERASPKYDRERSRSPVRGKASPEYRRGSSPSHHGRTSPDKGLTLSPSLHGERTNLDNGQARSPSPLQERTSPDADARDQSPPRDKTSPPTGVMASPNHRDISLSPPPQEKVANGIGTHRRSASPYPGEGGSPDNGHASCPAEKPELKERSPVEEY